MPFFFLVGVAGVVIGFVALWIVGTHNVATHLAAHLAFWMGMLMALVTHGFERGHQNQKAILAELTKLNEKRPPHS